MESYFSVECQKSLSMSLIILDLERSFIFLLFNSRKTLNDHEAPKLHMSFGNILLCDMNLQMRINLFTLIATHLSMQ